MIEKKKELNEIERQIQNLEQVKKKCHPEDVDFVEECIKKKKTIVTNLKASIRHEKLAELIL